MDEVLRELAELLDMGEKVFFHKVTHEILSYPDPQRWNDPEADYLEDKALERVIEDPGNFISLEPPESRVSFRIMEEFAFAQENPQHIARLAEALKGRKPFRHFRDTVDDLDLSDAWYDFKDAQMAEWVKEQLAEKWDG